MDSTTSMEMHGLTNKFLDERTERRYAKYMFEQNKAILQWSMVVLLLCIAADCGFLLSWLWTDGFDLRVYVTLGLASSVSAQLLIFLCRSQLCMSELIENNYQNMIMFLGTSGFSYFIFSDSLSSCLLFRPHEGRSACLEAQSQDDGRRVAYGMSLLFGTLPFCFRAEFVRCMIMFLIAILVHISLRLALVVSEDTDNATAIVSDALFLTSIGLVMLRGAYMFERNDRLAYSRMNRLNNELKEVHEQLCFAASEANTNEAKLEIERAKADLDSIYPGARSLLEAWVVPIEDLEVVEFIANGSVGEVYKGRLRFSEEREYELQQDGGLGNDAESLVLDDIEMQSSSGASARSRRHSRGSSQHHRRVPSGIPNYKMDTVAIKRIPADKINRTSVLSILQETFLLSQCRHPNILRLKALVWDPYVCLVFEYMDMGTLKNIIDSANPKKMPGNMGMNPLNIPIGGGLANATKKMKNRTVAVYSQAASMIHVPGQKHDPKQHEKKNHRRAASEQPPISWSYTKTRMCLDIAAGISYLHAHGIAHRDLKSENLLVNDTLAVKVADLGLARKIEEVNTPPRVRARKHRRRKSTSMDPEDDEDDGQSGGSAKSASSNRRRNTDTAAFQRSSKRRTKRPMSRVGTELYIAPEIVRDETYDEKCDVWSFGIILGELLTHRDPYHDEYDKNHFNFLQVVDGNLNPMQSIFPRSSFRDNIQNTDRIEFDPEEIVSYGVPLSLVELVQSCLTYDPNKRISMNQALFHLFEILVEDEVGATRAGNNLQNNVTQQRAISRHRLGNSSSDQNSSHKEKYASMNTEISGTDASSKLSSTKLSSLSRRDSSDLPKSLIERISSSTAGYQMTLDKTPKLRHCSSTHTLGEFTSLATASSPLSSYPSMNSISPLTSRAASGNIPKSPDQRTNSTRSA